MYSSAVIILFVAIAGFVFSHDDTTAMYECHTIETEDKDIITCHCHVPGESPIEVSCEEDLLSMELLLELEKVDQELFFGLRVEPEDTCTEYNVAEFPYGSTLDVIKAQELGGIFGAFENECFDTYEDVDVDHLVARKEAHDSGLCAADAQIKIDFSNDLENVALANVSVNRSKSDQILLIGCRTTTLVGMSGNTCTLSAITTCRLMKPRRAQSTRFCKIVL